MGEGTFIILSRDFADTIMSSIGDWDLRITGKTKTIQKPNILRKQSINGVMRRYNLRITIVW